MKKFMFFAGTLGITLAFVLAFSGCTSLGRPKLPATVTITGIPAEYEGGTVKMFEGEGGSGTIVNGSVSLTVQVADGNGFADLPFMVIKAGQPARILIFESVLFENQTAEVNWDDGEINQL